VYADGWDSPARKAFIYIQTVTPLKGFIQAHHPQVTQTVGRTAQLGGNMLNKFMELARDHYWDSLEPQKDLIIKHLESLVSMAQEEAAQHSVQWTAGDSAPRQAEFTPEVLSDLVGLS